ncbi:small GTPase-binding protein [Coprinopsis sp. MPI-PUGE-AT-0042]|nr:small GTPase-binding protein [Coprinopsis sp. MPI-PUGE-AT-0042]
MSASAIRRKLVAVGDGACGKTSLLLVYALGTFPGDTVISIFYGYVADVDIDGRFVELSLWDTSAGDEEERLRPLNYLNTQVILICFAIDSPSSLDRAKENWASEMAHYCPGVPIILVACKKDLRIDPAVIKDLGKMDQHPVFVEEGMAVAEKIGAKNYLECSAKTGEGLREVFDTAARVALTCETKKKKFRSCVVV